MTRIEYLSEGMRKLHKEAHDILDKGADVTSEESEQVDVLLEKVASNKREMDRLRALEDSEKELEASLLPEVSNPSETEQDVALDMYVRQHGHLSREFRGAITDETDPAGGYVSSKTLSSEIVSALKGLNYFMSKCRVITLGSSSQLGLPVWDGALTFTWGAAAISDSVPANPWGLKVFKPHDLTGLVPVAESLIEDTAVPLLPFLREEIATQMNAALELAFIKGSGDQEPQGLLTALADHQDDIAGGTDVIVPEDIIDATLALTRPYRAGAVWVMPTHTLALVSKFRSDGGGGAGTGPLMWVQSFVAGEPSRLYGYPVWESEQFSAPAANGDAMLAFFNPKRYIVVRRGPVAIRILSELLALQQQVGIRARIRLDAGLVDLNAGFRLNRN